MNINTCPDCGANLWEEWLDCQQHTPPKQNSVTHLRCPECNTSITIQFSMSLHMNKF